MLKKLLVCVPLVAVAMTGLSSSAGAASAPAADSARVVCTADTPEVKALVNSMAQLQAALTPQPDAVKVQTVIGDMITEFIALQKAGCLPQFPGTQVKADPTVCLNAAVSIMSSFFGVLSAALKAPPDVAGITTAMAAVGKAVAAFNQLSCLPFPLPVPGGGGLPGGLPAPPSLPPAPPGLPTP
ncbi:MAG: hypothetical protein JOZ47_14665 [Kutzneria sp.]|nr:hypothetical protein [Kutzneria sp.]MBV9846293.1 hypothetical protein [Kutzneria sp.]